MNINEEIKSYLAICKFIEENIVHEDETDEEATLVRKEFKEVNMVKINSHSVTLSIPTSYASAWVDILFEHYGRPLNNTALNNTATNNGLQFKTKDGVNIKI